MNIIERTKSILQSFPKIATICNDIHVDFTAPEPTSYGLSSVGDSLLKEDILGNQIRQHSFLLYAAFSGINDFERLENSSALLELALWLKEQVGAEVETVVGNNTYIGTITNITAGNGMLYAIPQENNIDGWQYQLQIIVRYTVEI